MKNPELREYLQTQLTQTSNRLNGLINNSDGKPLFRRDIFTTLQQYFNSFLAKNPEPRIIVMPGLRGTGKTTLLAQLFLSLPNTNLMKLYLSVEEAIKRFNVNLWDILDVYEELTAKHLEELEIPLFLFFDEIHYDENWAIFLKTIYDKSKNVMVFCTGSAALLLREQVNADVARRVFFVDVPPISFSEYMLLRHQKAPITGIEQAIKDAMLFSHSAKDAFDKLQQIENQVKEYWLGIDKFEIRRYIKLGTFPFTLNLENEVVATTFVSQIINKVIYTDIPQFYKFTFETINCIDKTLYLISDTLGVSLTKLAQTLEMKTDTVKAILEALERSGLINKIPPYGAHFKQIKKPAKYLFATPALRFSYLSSSKSISALDNYQGSLLEDTVGMYLQRMLPKFSDFALTYDVASGGADFIISFGMQKIVLEVGYGKKDYRQTIKTAEKAAPKYSIVIANEQLEYAPEHNAIKIPLEYFLLA